MKRGLAPALAQEAACLILDEPTASLDFGNQALVLGQIRALADRDGLAVLMMTYRPNRTFLVADEVAVLHRGLLQEPSLPGEISTVERLRDVYGVEIFVGSVPTPKARGASALPWFDGTLAGSTGCQHGYSERGGDC